MTNNVEIIKAAREVLKHLDQLLAGEKASEVRKKLALLLAQGESDNQDELVKKIIELLSKYEPTKLWMADRLSKSPQRSGMKSFLADEDTPHLYPVWFGTNREPVDRSDLAKGFKGEQCADPDMVYYGQCNVEVPKTHRFGETGRVWWKRWATLSFNGSESLKLSNIYTAKNADEFWNSLNRSFHNNDLSERDTVVFIHGFNTSFEDAAIRAAQIGFDLRVKGETAFFSWPSKGKGVTTYASDERSIEVSGKLLASFLKDFAQKSGAERVHLIAHSMGNRGLLKALESIMNDARKDEPDIKFGQIILAAPDLDVEVFRQAKKAYLSLSLSTTIYTSSKDIAVYASKVLHQYPRLGFVPPITTIKGIDTIKINNFDIFNLGHGYFAEAEALLNDIFDLVRNGNPPSDRQRPKMQITDDGKTYWLIDT